MTKFKPILFSTPMVEAINENRKSQTRRVIKHHCEIDSIKPVVRCLENEKDWGKFILTDINGEDFLINPFAQVGDVLWVRETFHNIHDSDNDKFLRFGYKADNNYKGAKWKPSLFMPKEACRLFLKVKAIRPEGLHDISTSDIKSEGIMIPKNGENILWEVGKDNSAFSFMSIAWKNGLRNWHSSKEVFYSHWAELWCKINGRKSWDENPFVWVIEFERIEKPNNFI